MPVIPRRAFAGALCAAGFGGWLCPGRAPATAGAPPLAIPTGALVRLPIAGSDAEFPVLAMNESARFVIAYPQSDPFGPLRVLTGRSTGARIRIGRDVQLGTGSVLSPLEPAVSASGRTALGWSVRRQRHPANRVAFGLDVGELAPRPHARWFTRTVMAPSEGYDPSDQGSAVETAFAGDRLLEQWTTHSAPSTKLVFARQSAVGGPLHARVLLTAKRLTTIEPAGLQADGAGEPVLAASLDRPARGSSASSRGRPTGESAVAFTTRSDGNLGRAQLLRRGCSATDLAVAPTGQAAVAMTCDPSDDHTEIWVDERAPHQQFSRALRVSGPGIDGVSPSISITADGRVCAVWDRVVGSAKHIDANIVRTEVSCAKPGNAFSRPEWQTGRYPTQLNPPTLLAGPSGPTLARGDHDDRVVLQRLLPASHLGPLVALSGRNARNQTVAVDGHGNGVALWDASINHHNQPAARSFTLP